MGKTLFSPKGREKFPAIAEKITNIINESDVYVNKLWGCPANPEHAKKHTQNYQEAAFRGIMGFLARLQCPAKGLSDRPLEVFGRKFFVFA